MRCRKIVNGIPVWFGNAFDEDLAAITSALTQKLKIFKGEIWTDVTFGLSILEKIKNKAFIDAEICKIVGEQKGVTGIDKFESNLSAHNYSCMMIINTIYGTTNVVI